MGASGADVSGIAAHRTCAGRRVAAPECVEAIGRIPSQCICFSTIDDWDRPAKFSTIKSGTNHEGNFNLTASPPALLPVLESDPNSPTPALCLPDIFCIEYRRLRPRAPMPLFDVSFYPFTGVNTTIRLREGKAFVRLSDMLEGAPESVTRAIAHILLAKLYRKPIEPMHANRYRQHLGSASVIRQAELVRRSRGRKNISTAQGHY